MKGLCVIVFVTAVLLGPCRTFPGTVSSKESGSIQKKEGETVNILCTMKGNPPSVSLKVRRPMEDEVLFYDFESKKITEHEDYTERFKVSVKEKKITISLHELQVKDSGLYSCRYSYLNDAFQNVQEDGGQTFVFVTERCPESGPMHPAFPDLMMVFIIAAGVFLFLLALAITVWIAPKVKGLCVSQRENVSRTYNPVYEDMHSHHLQRRN